MRIGIICAGDRELDPFFNEIVEDNCTEKAMLKFHEGKVGKHDVIYLYSGVCKVNAAIATQILIDNYQVNLVINAGVAGALDSGLQIFDTVICSEVAYHDVGEGILTDFHPWMDTPFFKTDDALLKKAQELINDSNTEYAIHIGRMVTGEAFIEGEERQKIIDKYHPLSVDMETASIAHVCYVNKIPFIAIRSFTDTADSSAEDSFEKNCHKASEIAKDVTMNLIKRL